VQGNQIVAADFCSCAFVRARSRARVATACIEVFYIIADIMLSQVFKRSLIDDQHVPLMRPGTAKERFFCYT